MRYCPSCAERPRSDGRGLAGRIDEDVARAYPSADIPSARDVIPIWADADRYREGACRVFGALQEGACVERVDEVREAAGEVEIRAARIERHVLNPRAVL